MNIALLSVLIQEGGKLCSEIIRLRINTPEPRPAPQPAPQPALQENTEEVGEGKIKSGTACLPCTNSHLHACRGLLAEATRMSPDGLNPDSMERVDKCLGEIAAAERIDLATENIEKLPADERKVADHALKELREIRHGLEGLTNKDQLEQLEVQTTTLQKYVGSEWFKIRMAKMPKEEKARLIEQTIDNLGKED